MSSSDLLDSAKDNHLEAGDATFTKASDDVNIKPNVKLIGLTKEELEKYRNDPFWKTIRYAMFALFWLIWLAMFAGAIIIVIVSPKCSKMVKCGKDLINYRIFVPAFRDSNSDGVGDFAGVQEKLSLLKSIGISGISVTPVFKTNDLFLPQMVTDLNTVDSRLGGVDQLKELISNAHTLGLCFTADIPLAVSRNIELDDAFLDVKDASGILDVSKHVVFEKLVEVAEILTNYGVDGIRFTTYGLFNESSKFAQLHNIIDEIRNSSKMKMKEIKIFTEQFWSDISSDYIDYPFYNVSILQNSFELQKAIDNATNRSIWHIGDVDSPRSDIGKLIQLVQLMLPYSVSVYYGEEIGLPSISLGSEPNPQLGAMRWNSSLPTFGFSDAATNRFYANYTFNSASNFKDALADSNSYLNAFKNVTALRSSLKGNFTVKELGGINYYAYINDDDKIPNAILAINWKKDKPLDLIINDFMKDKKTPQLTIKAHSMTKATKIFIKDGIFISAELGPREAIVFQLE